MTLTRHARQQARLKRFDLEDVYAAAERPTVTYAHTREGQHRHIRNGLVAVVDRADQRVITVYRDVEVTPLRADQ